MSDLAVIALALPTVDLAPVVPFTGDSGAIEDSQAVAIAVGETAEAMPQPAELLAGFFALLHELTGESCGHAAPTGAGRRQPEDPNDRDGDEDPNRTATLTTTTPVWLVESAVPSIEPPPVEPVSPHAWVGVRAETLSLAAGVAGGHTGSLAGQPLPAAAVQNPAEPVPIGNADAFARIEPPPGIRVSEEPGNAAAGRMDLAFGLVVEPQVESPRPGQLEPATSGLAEASARSEAPGQTASTALKEQPVGADPVRNDPVSPDEPQTVETGREAVRPHDRPAAAANLQAVAPQRESEPAVRMRNPEAADRPRTIAREPSVMREASSQSHVPAAVYPHAGNGPGRNGSARAEPAPSPAEPAVVESRQPEPSTREISLRVEAEPGAGRARAPVAVHVVERAGRIEIRVRSADPQLTQRLGREVPALMARLEGEGYRSHILAAAPAQGTMPGELSRVADPQAWLSPDGEPSHQGGAHPDSQQHRPRPEGRLPEDEAGPGEMSAFRRLHDGFLG